MPSGLSLDYKALLYKSFLKLISAYVIQLWGERPADLVWTLYKELSQEFKKFTTGVPWFITNENTHRILEMLMAKDE